MFPIQSLFNNKYSITEEGQVYDNERQQFMAIDEHYSFRLKNANGHYRRISLKTLYQEVFDGIICVDSIKSFDDEQWLPIERTNNQYYVSNYGRVKSLAVYEAKLLNPFENSSG